MNRLAETGSAISRLRDQKLKVHKHENIDRCSYL
jgi:hypothetical protein